jgi:hypothetical protein
MSDELDELRMLGEGCINEPRAQAKQEGPKLHTHTFSDPIADKLRTQTNELTRAYAIIGVLVERIQSFQRDVPISERKPVEISEEELVAISSYELKLEFDVPKHMIRLKVES